MAKKKAYDELDVEEYEIIATLDNKTSEICQEMDLKHFPISDYEPGITAPPFHPNCRTTTAPYFDDEFSLNDMRVARDNDGNYITVPASMNYEGWRKYISGEFADLENLYDRDNKYVVNKILDSTYGVKINDEKQEPHMKSTAKKGKSYLFDNINAQELFNKYAGTGIMQVDRKGNNTNKEICIADFDIGIDYRSGETTRMFKIHHSNKRTHIVP